MGHALIMGRRTFESIGRVLPGRRTIVVTRQHPGRRRPWWWRTPSRALGGPGDEVFVAGGGEVYAEAMPLADRLLITEVDQPRGAGVLPRGGPADWREEAREPHDGFGFVTYERVTHLAAGGQPRPTDGPECAEFGPPVSGSGQSWCRRVAPGTATCPGAAGPAPSSADPGRRRRLAGLPGEGRRHGPVGVLPVARPGPLQRPAPPRRLLAARSPPTRRVGGCRLGAPAAGRWLHDSVAAVALGGPPRGR